MIKLENTEVVGWEAAIRGMRNPKNSWDRSDSGICKGGDNGISCSNCAAYDCEHAYDKSFQIGKNDYKLMETLANGGPVHAKYRRMIAVYVDITAPLYWWKEFDTYKVGTVANSCSTMHKIAEKEFTLDDFSHEHLIQDWGDLDRRIGVILPCTPKEHLMGVIANLNVSRRRYLETKDKRFWWQMIQLLPSSYNQRRTVMLNYEVLANIYPMRKDHKLDEWHTFCDWIKSLPYSKLITFENDENVTLEGVLKDFKKHNRFLEKHIVDYRPGPQPYTIHIWLDIEHFMTGSREVIYNYKTKEFVSV